MHDLRGLPQVGEESGLHFQGPACTVEHAVTLAVPHAQPPAGARDAEHVFAVQVLQQPVFSRRVRDRIVGPGAELVQPAVHGPGVAAAGLRHLEAEATVGDHVDPRSRRRLARRQFEAELTAGRIEVADRRGNAFPRIGDAVERRRHPRQRQRRWTPPLLTPRRHLLFQRPAIGSEDHPRQAGQCRPFGQRDFLFPQQEEAGGVAARKAVLHGLQQAVAQRQDVALQRHQVGIRFAVDDHHIHRQPAEGPPGLRAQQRTQQRNAVGGVDPHQHDRLVAGQAEAPEQPLVERPAFGDGAGPAVHQCRGQVLQRDVFLGRHPEVPQPHLCQRRRHAHRPLDVHRLQVAVDARRQLGGLMRRRGGESQARHRAGGQPHPHAQAGHGIEAVDGLAICIQGLGGKRRVRDGPVAATERAAVGHAAHREQLAFDAGEEMRRGDLGVALQARPPGHHQRPPLRLPVALDEQVGERRMRLVGRRRRQHRLEARHQLAGEGALAGIAQGDDPQLGVVLRADQHRDAGCDVIALRVELHPVGHEVGLVVPAGAGGGTGGERNQRWSVLAPQVEKAAEVIAQQVVTPARDVLPAPAAHARAARAQCHAVTAVRQQVGRLPAAGRGMNLAGLEHRVPRVGAGRRRGPRIGALHDLPRRAFVQQQLVRRDHRVGSQPAPRRVAAQHVAQRRQRHAVVVRHEGFDHAVQLRRGLPRRREVECLEHAELAAAAERLQALQVGGGFPRLEHRRQQRRIRRDDTIAWRGAAQRQPRCAEGAVLEGQGMVLREIGRLRNAPRQPERRAASLLFGDGGTTGGMQQPADRFGQQQRGHQVLEHRPGPRFQSGDHADRQERPTQRAPVPARHIALGDGEQAGEPRFGRQQVVVAGVERLLLHPQADVEQVALAVVEAPEVHRHGQRPATLGDDQQVGLGRTFIRAGARQRPAGLRHGEQQAGEVAAVDGRHVGRRQDLQRPGVVPVQQVPAVARQALDRVQRGLQAAGQLPGTDPAELAGAAHRQQVQADIGRRGPVGDGRLRDQLQVVRRQVVVLGTDAALEEAPGVSRQLQQVGAIPVPKLSQRSASDGLRRPPADQRRTGPERKQQHPGERMPAPERRDGQSGAQQRGAGMLPHEGRQVASRTRLRLLRRGPLQQLAPADRHAPERTRDRIGQQHGLGGELAELPGGRGQRAQQRYLSDMEEVRPGNSAARRHHAGQRAQQGAGQECTEHHHDRADRIQRALENRQGEQQRTGGQHQRPPQVVAHLPESQRVDAEEAGPAHQRQQLPVAAGPAVQARGRHAGVLRVLLDQRDVADETATRDRPFEQVVAQHRLRRQAAVQHRVAGVDVQQPLAAEAGGAEQVLVDIRHAIVVRVQADLSGEQAVKTRVPAVGRERREQPRLQDAEAGHDAPAGRVHAGRVQRMVGDRHQFAQSAARQAGVAVQREDEPDAGLQPQLRRQRLQAFPAPRGQCPHQQLQLAALALPPQPAPLCFAPLARPVDQQVAGRGALRRAIARVECVHLRQRIGQQRRVGVQTGRVGIEPVGQQGELRLRFAIGEPVAFQLHQQQAGRGRRSQHGRDHDQHGASWRDALGEIQPWQQLHLQRFGEQPVHQRRGSFTGWPGQQEQEQDACRSLQVDAVRGQPQQHGAAECNGAEVQRQACAAAPLAGRRQLHCGRQDAAAVADQVVAGGALHRRPAAGLCDGHDGLRDLKFSAAALARELLHRARGLLTRELALAGEAGELAQHPQRVADRLDQVVPVQLADHPQRRDDVAYGEVGGDLRGLAFHHQRRAVLAVLLHPLQQCGRALRAVRRDALPELRQPGPTQAGVRHLDVQLVELLRRHVAGQVADGMRQFTRDLARRDLVRHPAQVLQQHHAQGGRQGPELGQAQLADFLVGVEEGAQDLGIENTVGMGHIGPGDSIDPGQTFQRCLREFGQLGVVAPGHAFPDLFELRFDQVEVVQQPVRRRSDIVAAAGDERNLVVGAAQCLEVLLYPRKEGGSSPGSALLHHLRDCKAATVFFEPVDAEQLGADRRLPLAGGFQEIAGVRGEVFQPVDGEPIRGLQPKASTMTSPTAITSAPVLTMREETIPRNASPAERRGKKRPRERLHASMCEASAAMSLKIKVSGSAGVCARAIALVMLLLLGVR